MVTSLLILTERTIGTITVLTARRTVLLVVLLCGALAALLGLLGGDGAAVPADDADMWITTDWEVRSPHSDPPGVTVV